MSIILATQEGKIGRIMVRGQPRQKVGEIPPQPIKLGALSFQLHGKHKQKNHCPSWPGK
jgi:hypothetical protein